MDRITIARTLAVVAIVLAVVVYVLPDSSEPHPGRPDPLERSLALTGAASLLNARILASSSATRALESWCADHELAPNPTVRAERDPHTTKPPSPDTVARLKAEDLTDIRYRAVRLYCGDVLLSEADNWYVHTRLTPAMNHTLDTTDEPFGRVVAPLNPRRIQHGVHDLWPVLPPGWENLRIDDLRRYAAIHQDLTRHDDGRDLFRHTAVLHRSGDDLPISEVHETYQMGTLRNVLPPR